MTWHEESNPTVERLKELLMGRRVVSALMDDASGDTWGGEGYLVLDDGTELKLGGNHGCGGCSSGWYHLKDLATVDNIITNVEVEELADGDYGSGPPCRTCGQKDCWDWDHDNGGVYRIFVFTDNEKINLAEFQGTDGNGYYGSGYWIEVVPPEQRKAITA